MKVEEIAKTLGRRGGRARARRLAAEDRKRIAALGGRSRARSLQAARRIEENFRYVEAARELRGGSPRAIRLDSFERRLPGIYEGRPGGLPRQSR